MINGIVAIVNPRQRLPQGLLVRIQGRAQILQVRILVPEAGVEEAQKNEQEALEQKSLLEGKNKELEKQIDELLK